MVKVSIKRCEECGDYTMHEKCKCGGEATQSKPPKYGDQDGRL